VFIPKVNIFFIYWVDQSIGVIKRQTDNKPVPGVIIVSSCTVSTNKGDLKIPFRVIVSLGPYWPARFVLAGELSFKDLNSLFYRFQISFCADNKAFNGIIRANSSLVCNIFFLHKL